MNEQNSQTIFDFVDIFWENLLKRNSALLDSRNLSQSFSTHLQVKRCQTYLFTSQLTHNMTTDCSMNYEFSTRKLQALYMLYTSNCFLFLFLH